MAKLSARGRKELIRMVTHQETPPLQDCYCCTEIGTGASKAPEANCITCKGSGQAPSLTVSRRITVALMSDRTYLEKQDVVFRSDNNKHSYGWKVKGKIKDTVTPEIFRSVYEKRGYTVES